jgi:hypothetical protein
MRRIDCSGRRRFVTVVDEFCPPGARLGLFGVPVEVRQLHSIVLNSLTDRTVYNIVAAFREDRLRSCSMAMTAVPVQARRSAISTSSI